MKSEKKKKRRKKRKEKKRCFRRANRCKQAASNASSRFRQENVFSFCREEVNNFLNKLKN
jgi:hypothetical protein